ncbi:hypothetical protein BN6_72430 [Saccharothrix espanaensis DSM 44229]|uniref:Uncharacterized protein n=1 Tax=Saccharothrix espanaensis (strain ATCC 51144 / DSM 44229 / JCM 9112 / NBRC 15066 / NRRL 15764) TaxID=1179773 RepID=K0K7W8_SACES|nr:hypothetical protein BN6_72430 [Saccharothrix espanaensis DSM 44229]
MSLAAFGLAWWLGLYLVARDPRKPVLRRASAGLVAYAAALALPVPPVVLAVPAVAWTGAIVCRLPERYDRWWRWSAVPLLVAAWFLPLVVLPPLGFALLLYVRRTRTLLGAATLMFLLGSALVFTGFTPSVWLIASIGVDLLLFGVLVALRDAFDEGEAIRADMVRSLLGSAGLAAVFGGQVALFLDDRLTPLLYGTVAAAIALQVLANPLAAVVDRVAVPTVAAERAELREAVEALPKLDQRTALDELDLVKSTRRALSGYGDLGRLVANPLTRLPVIDARLAARGAPDQPLERAAELKSLLLESILRLKPRDGEFGTSDEWRHYNALYFYYVVGIRPYSRRTKREDLDPNARKALAWFVNQVPERTLHNWQNAGAKLVAADLSARVPD